MRKILRHLMFVLAGASYDVAADMPNEIEYLKDAMNSYLDYERYEDIGSLTIEYTTKSGGLKQESAFATFFERQKKFTFHFSKKIEALEKLLVYRIESNNDQIIKYSPYNEPKEYKNIHYALAGFSGITSGVTTTVPQFLFVGMTEGRQKAIKPAKSDSICLKVLFKKGNLYWNVWIDKQNKLFKKVEYSRPCRDEKDCERKITIKYSEINTEQNG